MHGSRCRVDSLVTMVTQFSVSVYDATPGIQVFSRYFFSKDMVLYESYIDVVLMLYVD